MTTINELCRRVSAGTLSVSAAVDIVDSEGLTYGIRYFSPSSDAELPYWDMLREWTARHEPAEQPPESVSVQPPRKRGQLWEPCEKCGGEPSYMPLHLCSLCWPS